MRRARLATIILLVAAIVVPSRPAAADLGTTQLLSATPSGDPVDGGAIGGSLSISADGTVVAFPSDSNDIVPGDISDEEDIVVLDLATGSRELATVSSSGVQANSGSYGAVVSGDGRFVVFSNFADNLVPGDTNAASDVFIHDRLTGSTRRVSVSSGEVQANDASYESDVSADGRFVLFGSSATNLVPGDTNGQPDVFVRDRELGTTERVSLTSGGAQPNGWSGGATMSADGSIVAFWSEATNLVPGDTNGLADVFVRDLRTGRVTRADVSSSGAQANGTGYLGGASLDDAGDLVAFESDASNLVPGDDDRTIDAFVHDLRTGRTEVASVRSGTEAPAGGRQPSISGNGNVVAFVSGWRLTSGLPLSLVRGGNQLFVHDRGTGGTVHVSVDSAGRTVTIDNEGAAVDRTGRMIAFMGLDPSFDGRVYLRNRSPRVPGGPTILAGPTPIFATGLGASEDRVGVRVRSWAHDEQGVCTYVVERSVAGGAFEPVPSPDPTSWLVKSSIPVGAVGRFRLATTDCAGDPGTPRIGPPERPTMVQEDWAGVTASPSWTIRSDPDFLGGARSVASDPGASLRVSFTADGFAWIAERGPGQGRAEVYVDGVHTGHVRLWAASPKVPRIVFARDWTSAGAHEVKVVVVGTVGHPSVNVDAFAFLHPAV